MQDTTLTDLTWDHLKALIEAQVPESTVLEYKEALPGRSDDDKRELLRDISSMANASGGVVLYGVREGRGANDEHTNTPQELVGVTSDAPGDVQLWFEQVLRSGLSPKLSQFQVRWIPAPDGQSSVLAVGVPASLLAPHAVILKASLPFWRRIGSARHDMNIDELRQAFHQRGAYQREAMEFRAQRLASLEVPPVPRPHPALNLKAALVIHVLPLGRVDQWIDLRPFHEALARAVLTNGPARRTTFTLDGLLRFGGWENEVDQYILWLRCGGAEIFASCPTHLPTNGEVALDGVSASIRAVEWVRLALATMSNLLQVSPPYAVGLSVCGIQNRLLDTSGLSNFPLRRRRIEDSQRFTGNITLPTILIDEAAPDLDSTAAHLRLYLDAIWHAAGYPACQLYDDGGTWIGRTLDGWQGEL